MHIFGISLKRWQKIALFLCCVDYFCALASYFLALYLRFDFEFANIDKPYWTIFSQTVYFYGLFTLLVNWVFQLYNCSWRYVSYNEMMRCIGAGMISSICHYVVLSTYFGRMPQSYYVFGGTIQLGFLIGSRFIYRFLCLARGKYFHNINMPEERAMLVGAGSAGHLVLRDLSTTELRNIRFKCIIDDDANKWGSRLEGVAVVGGREQIPEMAQKYEISKIYIAIPRATKEQKADILNICRETSCEVKLLPGFYQFAGDEVSISDMQNVTVEDLMRDSAVTVNDVAISSYFNDKTVLVTGGGGSIGSELCRQIAACSPRRIIAFDHFENRVSALRQELVSKYPSLDFVVQIGSVQDAARIDQVMQEYHPQVVFHAAGYKHIGLMENSPSEAIKNNVLGTYWTAQAALSAGVEVFIYLSTDKAVNPASVLGASSRIGEMLLQVLSKNGNIPKLEELLTSTPHARAGGSSVGSTRFASIRFGNAFGSEGSAFDMFQQQIAEGGPVKVRHKDIKRFCMTVPDVVRLLLQASTFVNDDVTYVLDMGKPYSIDELARTLIKLKGYIPDKEIKIEYTGLQPGEKLCDEPLMWEEGMSKTEHPQIVVANHIEFQQDIFVSNLCRLVVEARNNVRQLGDLLSQVVHSYHALDVSSPEFLKSQLQAPQPSIDMLEQAAMHFDIPGTVRAVIPISSGYINRTYKVEVTADDGTLDAFALQRINTEVFASPQQLMENYLKVTRHLSQHLKISPRRGAVSNPILIPTKDGAYFHRDAFGCWRMMNYFYHVHSYDVVANKEVFYQAGKTFGAFLKAMSSMSPSELHTVIPDFHNTPRRYEALRQAIEKDAFHRAKDVAPEIQFIEQHVKLYGIIEDALKNGDIPLRIGHNDCNLNNVLFDNETNLPVAIIDLDTVMPSTPLYDFGDSMRSGTNTARDDEKDLSKVSCNLELYESYARGWLEKCGDMLTPKELELLPYASLVITSEDGIRFLTDHLNGDTYYHTSYYGQNLDRARTQLKLVADMEQKLPELQRIISDICKRQKICES